MRHSLRTLKKDLPHLPLYAEQLSHTLPSLMADMYSLGLLLTSSTWSRMYGGVRSMFSASPVKPSVCDGTFARCVIDQSIHTVNL